MAQQFCTACGARIEGEGQRFCVKCGAALDADAAPAASGAAGVEQPPEYDLTGFGQMNYPEEDYPQTRYVPPETDAGYGAGFSRDAWQMSGATQPMGDATPPNGMGGWQDAGTMPYPQPGAQPPSGPNISRIVIVVSAVVIVLVAVAFAVMNLGSCSNGSVPEPTSSTSVSADDPSSSSSMLDDDDGGADDADDDDADDADDADDDDADADDDEVYDALASAYSEMGSQADRIKDTAATLNNTIFESDRTKREKAAQGAYDLVADVAGLRDELKSMKVSSSSRYYDDLQTLIELQEDLYKRIDVMCQAWEISLQYDKPKDHESAITKPLSKDNDAKGVNIYKKDFESRYPNARPQR